MIDHEAQYGDDDYLSCYGDRGPHWVWITAGTLRLSSSGGAVAAPAPPGGWFADANGGNGSMSSQLSLAGEPWRVEILQGLRGNNDAVMGDGRFADYESPIERTSWVRKANAKFSVGGASDSRWDGCVVEMEQTGSPGGGVDFGTLSIFGTTNKKAKVKQL